LGASAVLSMAQLVVDLLLRHLCAPQDGRAQVSEAVERQTRQVRFLRSAGPVDPANGDVWIGDREQYRIVVYSDDGKFLRTMQMRNLVCAIHFNNEGDPWMGSGQDGQFLKLTRDGKVVGAIGNGMGIGPGQLIEASYFVFGRQGGPVCR
jgi:hypothetical protein